MLVPPSGLEPPCPLQGTGPRPVKHISPPHSLCKQQERPRHQSSRSPHSLLVPPSGLEPPRPFGHRPSTCRVYHSATGACGDCLRSHVAVYPSAWPHVNGAAPLIHSCINILPPTQSTSHDLVFDKRSSGYLLLVGRPIPMKSGHHRSMYCCDTTLVIILGAHPSTA